MKNEERTIISMIIIIQYDIYSSGRRGIVVIIVDQGWDRPIVGSKNKHKHTTQPVTYGFSKNK